MLKTFVFATRLLWREWRAGEWFVIFFALLFAISAVTSLHFFTDRLVRGMEQQGAKFLGGDLVVTSSTPIPSSWLDTAKRLQLKTAEVWSYPSVITHDKQLQLVNLQAVSDTYPLYGKTLQPNADSVWIEPRLLSLLLAKLNDTLTVGAKQFQIQKILTADIDTLNTGWTIAPRLMIRLQDVPATQTVLPGSRIDYRLLLVGEAKNLQAFKQWIMPQLQSSQNLLDVHNQKFALLTVLERTENYLQLVLLACLIMSGVAISLSVHQYLRRHYAHVALWRCLGAKQQQITQIFFYQLLIVALGSGAIAIAIGYGLQTVFADLFKTYLVFPLPSAGIAPILLGFTASIFLLFAFAYPVIDSLPRTPPLYLWRNEITQTVLWGKMAPLISLFCIAVAICCFLKFSLLSVYFLGILFFSVIFLSGLALLLLTLIRKILSFTEGATRRGLNQLVQHRQSVSLQFVGFNLILIALIVVGLIRSHLLANWQESLSTTAPNYFAINIAPTDLTVLNDFFKQHEIKIDGMYPMVRGRLVKLNGNPILESVPAAANNNNALHRELNLSWMLAPPTDNKIVVGTAITKRDIHQAVISVEKKLADDLQLKLGSTLTFQIGEQQISATIKNFRTVDWSSFHPNFFILFPPGILDNFPTTYITSFHLAAAEIDLLNQLVQSFPNITVIDVASLLAEVQALVSKLTIAVQYLFLFALGSGILIFMTSLQASRDERRQTYHLLRVLGASKKYIRHSLTVEFTGLFGLIIFSSLGLAYFIFYILQNVIFK